MATLAEEDNNIIQNLLYENKSPPFEYGSSKCRPRSFNEAVDFNDLHVTPFLIIPRSVPKQPPSLSKQAASAMANNYDALPGNRSTKTSSRCNENDHLAKEEALSYMMYGSNMYAQPSRLSLNNDHDGDVLDSTEQYTTTDNSDWKITSNEAALLVKEGERNENFSSHPRGRYSKMAYYTFHHPMFYLTNFIACCLLLLLAIIERPSLIPYPADQKAKVVAIHTIIEFILLTVIGLSTVLRIIWMKPSSFLRQRTSIMTVVLIVMYIEIIAVLIQTWCKVEYHLRVLRSLRIIFFVDSYIMSGMRRVLRQIFQCLLQIIDVLILQFIIVVIFALIAYYGFAEIDPAYFSSYVTSLVSLFVALTTANHPDVFMEAYNKHPLFPIFFIVYVFVTVYFFYNVLLAVMYSSFSNEEKKKFKELFLHKREALKLAFHVLIDEDAHGITYNDFHFFMLEYNPRIPEYQVMCMFKALHDDSRYITLENFQENFYEMTRYNWEQVKVDGRNFHCYTKYPRLLRLGIKIIFAGLYKLVKCHYFNSVISFIIFLNIIYLTVHALITSFYCSNNGTNDVSGLNNSVKQYCGINRFDASSTCKSFYISLAFTIAYLIEIIIRLLAVGPLHYFSKLHNLIDFSVIVVSFIALCFETLCDTNSDAGIFFCYLVVIRPIKLFRILQVRKRYYIIMDTMFTLFHRLLSVCLLLFVVIYSFAIIGMEVFREKIYVGCCKKALYKVGSFYRSDGSPPSVNVFWLNNFDNIYQSYITLYEEMVVNNWFIEMEALVSETHSLATRIYFILFWCIITVCLSVVIAYILDAFVFRIQSDKEKCDKHNNAMLCTCQHFHEKEIDVTLDATDINIITDYETNLIDELRQKKKLYSLNMTIRKFRTLKITILNQLRKGKYIGKRLMKTREDLSLQIYQKDLQSWITEHDEQEDFQDKELLKATMKRWWKNIKDILRFILE